MVSGTSRRSAGTVTHHCSVRTGRLSAHLSSRTPARDQDDDDGDDDDDGGRGVHSPDVKVTTSRQAPQFREK